LSDSSLWLVLAGILLIAELTTGTFYLLMVSIGALVGAAMAHLGFGLPIQISVAAVFSVLATLALIFIRKQKVNASADMVQLDVGNRIQVDVWGDDHRSNAQYRGASWAVESLDAKPTTGPHQIVAVEGTVLKVKHLFHHH
jgi:membrane protein implicated in regulation of membrane protease activity